MVSISSKSEISKRFKLFWISEQIWTDPSHLFEDIQKINSFYEKEYALIPQKDRIGKGSIYLSYIFSKSAVDSIKQNTKEGKSAINLFDFILQTFDYGNNQKQSHLLNFSITLLGEYASDSKSNMIKALNQIKIWVEHPEWAVREICCVILRKGLHYFPDLTLYTMKNWIQSDSENLRRLVTESCRPLNDMKWLRDPLKNDEILNIISVLKSDPSEYVRKSVGNNFKDLTKYMPEKILDLFENWIKSENIQVTDDLAAKNKKELGNEIFYMIWTMKHALRWLQDRNPEYHDRIQKIMGKNYIKFFDEKKNKRAIQKP